MAKKSEIRTMPYYTEKNKLVLTEYGRNIQQMVEYAMTIEDKEERTKCVHTIINIMGNLFPHLRDVNDFKHKLWDHLAMMSNYKLDIDYPYDVPKELTLTRPEKLPYPNGRIRYRHYGQAIDRFINAIPQRADEEEKARLTSMIANHMKKCYLVWNKDVVEDTKIFDDIREMSDGMITMDAETKLRESKDLIATAGVKKQFTQNKNQGRQPMKRKKQ